MWLRRQRRGRQRSVGVGVFGRSGVPRKPRRGHGVRGHFSRRGASSPGRSCKRVSLAGPFWQQGGGAQCWERERLQVERAVRAAAKAAPSGDAAVDGAVGSFLAEDSADALKTADGDDDDEPGSGEAAGAVVAAAAAAVPDDGQDGDGDDGHVDWTGGGRASASTSSARIIAMLASAAAAPEPLPTRSMLSTALQQRADLPRLLRRLNGRHPAAVLPPLLIGHAQASQNLYPTALQNYLVCGARASEPPKTHTRRETPTTAAWALHGAHAFLQRTPDHGMHPLRWPCATRSTYTRAASETRRAKPSQRAAPRSRRRCCRSAQAPWFYAQP